MQEIKKKFSLVKPSIETPFHIDFEWWKETDSNWRVFLFDFLFFLIVKYHHELAIKKLSLQKNKQSIYLAMN